MRPTAEERLATAAILIGSADFTTFDVLKTLGELELLPHPRGGHFDY
jgi:hypothetical protein